MCKQLMQSYNHEVQQAEIPIEFKLLVKIACEMGSYFLSVLYLFLVAGVYYLVA